MLRSLSCARPLDTPFSGDGAIRLGYFLLVVLIGFLSSRKEHTSVQGYFRANNRLPWYVIGFSIVAAGVSSELN